MTVRAEAAPAAVTVAPERLRTTWRLLAESLTRPYPVTLPIVVFLAVVPFYWIVGRLVSGRTIHTPALPLDRLVTVEPTWALVYGCLYLFLIVLPIFVVRQPEHVRRTVFAYTTVWITAYVCFLAYPTIAPRPAAVLGKGFMVWGLRFLYTADTAYNCFPSLHVAHSFVSAFTCYPVHRKVGVAATVGASLVALSTLFTRQHYVVDIVAGILLAGVAHAVFLRHAPRERIPEADRRLAPVFAVGVAGIVALVAAGFWVVHRLGGAA